jgi:hypothetical protein
MYGLKQQEQRRIELQQDTKTGIVKIRVVQAAIKIFKIFKAVYLLASP